MINFSKNLFLDSDNSYTYVSTRGIAFKINRTNNDDFTHRKIGLVGKNYAGNFRMNFMRKALKNFCIELENNNNLLDFN